MKRRCLRLAASSGFVALVFGASTTWAQVAPPLGVAQQFGVLGNSAVTGATGTGVLVGGDVGSSPTPTISNFPPSSTTPPFTVHFTNDGVVQQAHTDAIASYNALLIQGPGTVLPDNLATVGALGPGIYSFVSGAPDLPASATLTLNGTGIFIFNVASSLTANVLSNVVGTANPCDIYWRVGTSATLNGTNFRGTVIADASITVGSGANLAGRALAGTGATGAVTMAGSGGNTIGGCSAAPVPTLPPLFVVLLAVGLIALGYAQLRRRARMRDGAWA
jgi:ice-binding like protein